MNATEKPEDHAEQNACGWLETIREHVACLEADRDRLEELRDERDSFESEVPDDFEVSVLDDDDEAEDRVTCGTCGRSWDDAIVTSMTPAPSARCPFEAFHQTWAEENRDDAEELAELEKAVTVEGDELDQDAIRERIQESPLSVQVRGGWHDPGAEDDGAEEFEILLSTGGPALRIVGDLDGHGQPSRARLEHQDWYKPWTEKVLDHDGYEALLIWCQQFYFGE